MDEARALLSQGHWVTLVGLPGVGKSALAEALAAEFGDRVVVLDGGIDGAAERAGRAGRAVLACAHAPLRVPGEYVVRVPLLAVPSDDATTEAILAAPAVEAFLMAARRLGTPRRAPRDEALEIRAVVRRTSGLPLAIELAAAQLEVLSLDALARLLERPRALAAAASSSRPAKHASLEAALSPALDRLSPEARALLVEIAPHARGVSVDPKQALAVLRELSESGFTERSSDAPEGETWVRAPAIVGALALELAPLDEARHARDAHVRTIGARVRGHARAVLERNDARAAAQLAASRDDVLLALSHAEEARDAALAIVAADAVLEEARARRAIDGALLDRLEALGASVGSPVEMAVAMALERAALMQRGGERDRAMHLLERARTLSRSLGLEVQAKVAMARGLHLRDMARDYGRAREAFEEAARSPDPFQRALALSGAGGTLTWAERFGEAIRAFDEAREVLLGVDAPRMSAVIATNFAIARIGHWPAPLASIARTRDIAEARRAVESFLRIGDVHAACVARQAVALTLTTLLRFEEAEAELRSMLALAESADSGRYVAVAELNLGEVAFALGKLSEAELRLAHGLERATALDDRLLAGVAHGFLGDLAWERGEVGKARDALVRARAVLGEDREHATRLALFLAEEAVLLGERGAPLAARAEELAGDDDNVHRHAVRLYAAITDQRGGRGDACDARALPWLTAQASLLRTPVARRGSDGLGIPFAIWLALRRFMRSLAGPSRRAMLERAHGLDAPLGSTLLLDADRRWVRVPSGAWIDLSRRERPFALLEALARRTEATHHFEVAELVARVWPGEKMIASAGANRVYAATAMLRKLPGLRDVLESDARGYRIAPEIDVVVFRESERPA